MVYVVLVRGPARAREHALTHAHARRAQQVEAAAAGVRRRIDRPDHDLGDPRGVTRLSLVNAFRLHERVQARVALERHNSYKEALFNLGIYF